MGDSAYDASTTLAEVERMGAEPVISPRSNRLEQRDHDREQGAPRRVLHRQDKALQACLLAFRQAHLHLTFLHFASVLIWLR